MSGGGKGLPDFNADLVARNKDLKRSRFDRRGKNISVGANFEDLWVPGGRMTWLTAQDTLNVVSSSTDDDAAGVGARILLIYGVDENYEVVTELVTMDGTTPVTTTNEFFRVNSVQFVSAGSTGYNVGNITITDTTGGTTQAYIEAEIGVYHSMNFSIPAGYHLVLTNISMAAETAQDVELCSFIRAVGAGLPFWACYTDEIIPGGRVAAARNIPSLIPEKTDVNLRVKKLSGTSGACLVSYIGYLYEGNDGVNANRPFNPGL